MSLSNRTIQRGDHAVRSVVLVDPQPVVQDGIAHIVAHDGAFQLVACAATSRAAQEAIARHRPTLAIVELMLDREDGLELVSWIHAHHRATRVLVFSLRDPAVYAERAIRAGALGYVSKLEAGAELLGAMRAVSAGEMHTPRSFTARLALGLHGRPRSGGGGLLDVLTDRELQVFEILGSGRSTQQIADALNLSIKTIATHRAHIQRKLGIPTLGELVRRAVLWAEQQQPHDEPARRREHDSEPAAERQRAVHIAEEPV